jgi:hypothetical protein
MKNKLNSPNPGHVKIAKGSVSPSLTKNWSTTEPVGPFFSACIACHEVWYVSARGLYGFDQFTGMQKHSFVNFGKEGVLPTFVQPFEDGVLVACTNNSLYYIDLSADEPERITIASFKKDEIIWMTASYGSVYLYSEQGRLIRVPPKAENSPVIITGPQTGTIPYPNLGPDGVYLGKGEYLNSYDFADLHKQSSVKLNGIVASSNVRSACKGQVFCMATQTKNHPKSICAISTGEKPHVLWTVSFEIEVRELLTDELYCYVTLANGSIMVLDIFTGAQATFGKKQIGPFKLGKAIRGKILQQDGILYATSIEDTKYGAGANVYAINLKTGVIVKMRTNANPQLIEVENDVLYYADHDLTKEVSYAIHAVRMSDLAREFYAESMLMQEMSFSGKEKGVGAAPSKTARIVTEITLYDQSGSPRLRQGIRIGATAITTLQCNGIDYPVGPSTFADITTDANGRIRLSIEPGSTDSKGNFQAGLTCPGLTLFSTFMDSDLSILIRPDAQLHELLIGITGEKLTNGKDFAGKLVIKKDYRNNIKAMDDVAKTIQTTAVMVKQSVDHKNKLMAGRQHYLANGSDPQEICCCADGNYHCKVICTNNYAFDLGTPSPVGIIKSTFIDQMTQAQVQRWLKDHPLTTNPSPMSWSDFWEFVESGAAAITSAIVYDAKKVQARVSALIKGVIHTIDLVIDTLEKAALVAQGIFNKIAETINQVIEMFSFFFEWEAILETKDMLKENINSALDKLLKPDHQGAKSLFDQMKKEGDKIFGNLKSKMDQGLTDLENKFNGISGKSIQDDMGKKAGMVNPAAGGAKSNWLQAKVSDHVLSKKAIETQMMLMQDSGQLTSSMFPELDLPTNLAEKMKKMLQQLREKINKDAGRTQDKVQRQIPEDIGSLFSAAMSFFIKILRDAFDIGIEIVRGFFNTLMDLLKQFMTALHTYINKDIELPFLSDLYRFITKSSEHPDGSNLTILDLVCLLLAIPTQLLTKLAPDSKVAANAADTVAKLTIAGGFGQILWGLFSAANSSLNVTSGPQGAPFTRGKVFKGIQTFLVAGIGGTVRALFLAADILSMHRSQDKFIANTIIWAIPTACIMADTFILTFDIFGQNFLWGLETGIALSAVGFLTGIIGIGFSIYFLTEDIKMNDFNLAFTLFDFLVSLALVIRPFGLISPPNSQYAVIGVSAVFVAASGFIKLATGLQVLHQLKQDNGFYNPGVSLA